MATNVNNYTKYSEFFNSNKLMFDLTKFKDGSSHSVRKTKSSRLIFLFYLGVEYVILRFDNGVIFIHMILE